MLLLPYVAASLYHFFVMSLFHSVTLSFCHSFDTNPFDNIATNLDLCHDHWITRNHSSSSTSSSHISLLLTRRIPEGIGLWSTATAFTINLKQKNLKCTNKTMNLIAQKVF